MSEEMEKPFVVKSSNNTTTQIAEKRKYKLIFELTCMLTNSKAQLGLNLSPKIRVLLRKVVRTRLLDNEVFRFFTFNLHARGMVYVSMQRGKV
ncbi:CLUMA_CG003570, isoform A [Clunio marinus]|uniref:CLUMA_CG003570, isoform A n=1 Tax=Clunio marinus TaxID=568069 RepID=A0A1J1HQX3_9DIPT|nr:CLUMA_CG003570, isoform A [Clunio marinus]